MSTVVRLRARAQSQPQAVATAHGVDPLILSLYALLAVAACGRSAFQLATQLHQAPLAYGLSAVAAGFYAIAGLTLRRASASPRAARLAQQICAAELAGVLLVGALTVAEPHLFPRDTVWSHFGAGYGFAPLLLPSFTLRRLRHSTATQAPSLT